MKFKMASAAVGLVAMAGVSLTGGVASAQAGSAAGTSAVAAKCSYTKITADESVKIRKSAKLSATAVGLFPKGAHGKRATCGKVKMGGKYNLCGEGVDYRWDYINYRGTKGWVPLMCITWNL